MVPIFRRRIAAGGPVTVADPRMTRYFMTIPEAVQLIIRAASLANGGEIFVLDMGEPVKIIELAQNMIRLSGQEPDVDIAIKIVGPRAEKKVHEDLFNPNERSRPTGADKIVAAERDRSMPTGSSMRSPGSRTSSTAARPPTCRPQWPNWPPSACSPASSAPRRSNRLRPVLLHDPRSRLWFDALMTALQAAGGGLPLALHIPHVVEQAGRFQASPR